MAESKEIKTIGVIGIGSIGMRHKNNLWQHLKQTEVVGYDPDPNKLNGTGWVVGDAATLINMCDPIIIACDTTHHWDYVAPAVIGGKKIFMEKPLWDRDINEIPDNILMVGYNLRFHSCVRKAKEWMKLIGPPQWANFTLGQFSEKPPYLRDGVILNWSHEIDLALHLLGPAKVTGSSTRLTNGKDDISDILLHHDTGCNTVVHLDYVTQPEVRQGIIVGKYGTIIFDLLRRVAWLRDYKDVIKDMHEGKEVWNDDYVEEMQAFLDRCDGKETIGCTGQEGLAVLRVCLEVRKQAGL